MRLKDRVVLITGASRGIGRATALRCAREGAAVVVNYQAAAAAAEEVVASIRADGGRAIAVQADVSDAAQVDRLVERALDAFGAIHVLVCNASICPFAPWEQIAEDVWDRVMAVNVKGTFFCCQRVVPVMRRQGYGRIVVVSSLAGRAGGITTPLHYAASKGAQLAVMKSLARALAGEGILVNAVAPAAIDTEILDNLGPNVRETLKQTIPLHRLGTAEEVAEAIVFLAADATGFITGEVIDINGGILID